MNSIIIGNSHTVIFDDDPDNVPLEIVGPILELNNVFPNKSNVEFVQIKSPNNIKIVIWERGVGVTKACGTGACASAISAISLFNCNRKMKVEMPGGVLDIEWVESSNRVIMTGPATEVFTGSIVI